MAQHYLSFMAAESQNIQDNQVNLIEEIGHLQLAKERHESLLKLQQ